MIDLASVGLKRKQQYSDSTLGQWKKSELIAYIRMLEHNYDVQVSFNIQQCKNFEEMLKGERKWRGEE